MFHALLATASIAEPEARNNGEAEGPREPEAHQALTA
jgi:hypothetical protein